MHKSWLKHSVQGKKDIVMNVAAGTGRSQAIMGAVLG